MNAWPVAALLAATLLASCDQRSRGAGHGTTPGDRLEAAAQAAGLVADPAHADPVGLYGRDGDRLCLVPRDGQDKRAVYGVGLLVRYDDGQGCTARGTAVRSGERLDLDLDGDPCRVTARFEGDRIVLPAELPASCDQRCTGRASLAALDVERLSDGIAEAMAQVDGSGHALCGG